MKVIAFANDTKNMAIRFLSQEIRLKHPGCNILVVTNNAQLGSLSKVDYLFLTGVSESEIDRLGGKLYTLQGGEQTMRDYHAEVMVLLPEILA